MYPDMDLRFEVDLFLDIRRLPNWQDFSWIYFSYLDCVEAENHRLNGGHWVENYDSIREKFMSHQGELMNEIWSVRWDENLITATSGYDEEEIYRQSKDLFFQTYRELLDIYGSFTDIRKSLNRNILESNLVTNIPFGFCLAAVSNHPYQDCERFELNFSKLLAECDCQSDIQMVVLKSCFPQDDICAIARIHPDQLEILSWIRDVSEVYNVALTWRDRLLEKKDSTVGLWWSDRSGDLTQGRAIEPYLP